MPLQPAARSLPPAGTIATVSFIGARARIVGKKQTPFVLAVGRIDGGEWDGETVHLALAVVQNDAFWNQFTILTQRKPAPGEQVSADEVAELIQGRTLIVELRPEIGRHPDGQWQETGRISAYRLRGVPSPLVRALHPGGTSSTRIAAFKARRLLVTGT